jgi:hypothetical protein
MEEEDVSGFPKTRWSGRENCVWEPKTQVSRLLKTVVLDKEEMAVHWPRLFLFIYLLFIIIIKPKQSPSNRRHR